MIDSRIMALIPFKDKRAAGNYRHEEGEKGDT